MFRITMTTAALSALVVALVAAPTASSAQKPADENLTGVKVGDKAPSFKLMDQNGQEQSLDEIVKKGKTALIFYRSASW